MHNAHVVRYFRFMCWLAERERRPLAQIVFYTAAMREVCPGWRVEVGDEFLLSR